MSNESYKNESISLVCKIIEWRISLYYSQKKKKKGLSSMFFQLESPFILKRDCHVTH